MWGYRGKRHEKRHNIDRYLEKSERITANKNNDTPLNGSGFYTQRARPLERDTCDRNRNIETNTGDAPKCSIGEKSDISDSISHR